MHQPLTPERLRALLDYCPLTGEFTWREDRHAVARGTRAGSTHKGKGYINIRVDLRLYRAHRLAWLHVHGRWPTHEIDHVNGVKSDNCLSNLRDVPRAANMQNQQRAHQRNKTGLLGAHERGGRFESAIRVSGQSHYLGSFGTAAAANGAYLAAKRLLHVDCSEGA